MSLRWLFALVGLLAALAGTGLWLATRPASRTVAIEAAPAAIWAASFRDLDGRSRSLGEFQGRIVVLNFWATWCAPCREEMPGFQRLQGRWPGQVQFVGISADDASKVAAFARGLGVTYPLWVGGDEVAELSKRLGNRGSVLPYTVVLDRSGRVAAVKVGAYGEAELADIVTRLASNVGEPRRSG